MSHEDFGSPCLEWLKLGFMTHAGLGVGKAVRVGHNLQEDVHLVQDGREGRVTSIISHDLVRGLEM